MSLLDEVCDGVVIDEVAVPLVGGEFAFIDYADMDLVMCASEEWMALRPNGAASVYAVAKSRRPFLYMHRLILGVTARRQWCDHVDGDGLNNRRTNLRLSTPSQNCMNRRTRTGSRSGFKGVAPYFDPRSRKQYGWTAWITVGGAHKYLGLAGSAEDAALLYDDGARRYHGEFARLNFPRDGEQAAKGLA